MPAILLGGPCLLKRLRQGAAASQLAKERYGDWNRNQSSDCDQSNSCGSPGTAVQRAGKQQSHTGSDNESSAVNHTDLGDGQGYLSHNVLTERKSDVDLIIANGQVRDNRAKGLSDRP